MDPYARRGCVWQQRGWFSDSGYWPSQQLSIGYWILAHGRSEFGFLILVVGGCVQTCVVWRSSSVFWRPAGFGRRARRLVLRPPDYVAITFATNITWRHSALERVLNSVRLRASGVVLNAAEIGQLTAQGWCTTGK